MKSTRLLSAAILLPILTGPESATIFRSTAFSKIRRVVNELGILMNCKTDLPVLNCLTFRNEIKQKYVIVFGVKSRHKSVL